MNPNLPELPLREIHLPSAITWWPPAPGWWILLAFSLILFFGLFMLLKQLLKPTLKKQAFKQLKAIENMFQKTGNANQCVSELSIFLRRTVLRRDTSSNAAGLTGTAWLQLLDQPLDTPEFSQGSGRILLKGPYQQAVDETEVNQFIQLCYKWVDRL
ncbi:MAG: DUF4381 domain-containing protein [Parachlamydiaceae bacterium]|nr:DUF4381 domain-containing protein [Parachlamydiaceae bacterium]